MSVNGRGDELSLVPMAQGSVQEPETRLLPTDAPSLLTVGGSVPELHLHQHTHHGETLVDQEARDVMARLAGQHGELFHYLQGEIQKLQNEKADTRFAQDVVVWVGMARGIMEKQGAELKALQVDLRTTNAAVVAAQNTMGKLQAEMGEHVAQLRQMLEQNQHAINGLQKQLLSVEQQNRDERCFLLLFLILVCR